MYINEGINHYNHTKSFTKNYLLNTKNTIIKNNNLRQFRQKIQRRIFILMNNENKFSNNSVGKNKNKTKRNSLILKEISFNNSKIDKSISQKNYPNKKVTKMSFERVIDHKYKKKMNNNNVRIKPKKMFKKFFEKKNIEVATNIKLKDKQKVSEPLRAKMRTNKLSHGISIKRNNVLKKNSINKSTTITTTSRTEISIEKEDKKHDDENFIFKNQVNKNKILNFVSFMKENNNKRIVCKSKEFRRRINSSFEKKDNSFENIINVLTVNPEEILDKRFEKYDNFNDLNSIIRKINYDKIKKETQSIFSIYNNSKYDSFSSEFNMNIDNVINKNKVIISKNSLKKNKCFTSRENSSKKKINKAILKGK